jgi:UDP-N-acetylglucosamine--N-acetylmuramyl-(pentapeptide) pyrophosphoryl-undecaprenol N-acetylglucosamine transferase
VPGVCAADVLRARGHAVTLWLTGRDVERTAARCWGGPVETAPAAAFRAGDPVGNLAVGLGLVETAIACRRRMRAAPPDVLLAMGSYACVGPALAARVLGAPLVVHEANAVPGRATQVLSCLADARATAFEGDGASANGQAVWTGLPLRASVLADDAEPLLDPGPFTLLVMGGSQGARRLNTVVPQAMCRLHAAGEAVRVVHLAGRDEADAVRTAYAEAGVPHVVYGFLDDMARAYATADFAVARAGASTCAELAARRVPALLVPLPTAARNHQAANARALESRGAADMVGEDELSAEWLCVYLRKCMRHTGYLAAMRAALAPLGRRDGAERLADVVEQAARKDRRN